MLANQWPNWWCCLYWSACLTTLKSHQLFSQNTDLPVVLRSETIPCFRKGWMLFLVTPAGTTSLTLRKSGCLCFAFPLLQHECRSNLCRVPFWCFFMCSLSDLLFSADRFKLGAKSNTLKCLLLRKKCFIHTMSWKCFGETKLASLCSQQRQLTVALFYLPIFNIKKVEI